MIIVKIHDVSSIFHEKSCILNEIMIKNRKTLLPEALEASQETPEKDAAEEWKTALVNVPCPLCAFRDAH